MNRKKYGAIGVSIVVLMIIVSVFYVMSEKSVLNQYKNFDSFIAYKEAVNYEYGS